jgi:hypothetical protein
VTAFPVVSLPSLNNRRTMTMMKQLITTTALTALLAMPAAAQQESESGAASEAPGGMQMEIQASSLIGKRLYIQRQDAEAQQLAPQEGQQPQETEQAAGAETEQTGEQQAESAAQPEASPAPDMEQLAQGVDDVPDAWTMAGEIDDVLMTQDGQVEALVVDAGGFLGMNESTRRIDIQEVRFVPDTDDEGEFFAVFGGDRQAFEGSEPFDEASLQEGMVRGSESFGEEIQGGQSDVAFTSITSDELVGTAVYGSEDNWVGEISELALSESGDVEAVIVDVGGFLGIGEKPVALTMEQIQIRRGEGGMFGDDLRAYVNATQDELESMETWEDDAG